MIWDFFYYFLLDFFALFQGNHHKVARDAGFDDRREYRYYNKETCGLDLNGMLEDLQVDIIYIVGPSGGTFSGIVDSWPLVDKTADSNLVECSMHIYFQECSDGVCNCPTWLWT